MEKGLISCENPGGILQHCREEQQARKAQRQEQAGDWSHCIPTQTLGDVNRKLGLAIEP